MKKMKTCVVCGKPVVKGTGCHKYGKLVHKACKGLLITNPRRYL